MREKQERLRRQQPKQNKRDLKLSPQKRSAKGKSERLKNKGYVKKKLKDRD